MSDPSKTPDPSKGTAPSEAPDPPKMSDQCARRHSQYVHHAYAYGLAGQVESPFRHTINTQASAVLGASGGRAYQRVENFQLDGIVHFKAAYVEVGGRFDECHNRHTSYATAVIEGLNILDVFTADKVVSRMAIYSAEVGKKPGQKNGEATFDITGSHFVNLRIAGHPINVKLDTHVFHEHESYSQLVSGHKGGKLRYCLVESGFSELDESALKELEVEYHALAGMSEIVEKWKKEGERPPERTSYSFSPVSHLKIEEHVGATELRGFGSIICIPKFGVVRLAEMNVTPSCRSLTMFRVQMCSTGTGSTDGTGTGGSGGSPPSL
ncbi:MAG TPA: hypothetical protein VKE93_20680 [Candidatus Angelobacter sp.]|nr:hypothetical protein [Candidatus Angelobacter sp.]